MTGPTSTRRAFLGHGLAVAAAPALVRRPPGADGKGFERPRGGAGGRVLVVVHLAGGNDGLNTVVPFADAAYHRVRPDIRLEPSAVHGLNPSVGLHPNLGPLLGLYRRRQVAVVQAVGCAGASRSHFRAADAWHSGDPGCEQPTSGWLGRYLDRGVARGGAGRGVYFGGVTPLALRGERVTPLQADAGAGDFVATMRRAGAMLRGDAAPHVFFLQLGGFDTHANQRGRHDTLMKTFAGGVAAFWAELSAPAEAGRVLMMAYSEFGRAVAQNAAGGTDHGGAGPVFLFGPRVRGGVYGPGPSLTDVDAGGLRHRVDFRSVYATVLERWLGVPAGSVLGDEFPTLPLFG